MRGYEELLERALEKLADKDIVKRDRFEVPRAITIREGTKTALKNFSQIARALNRSENHLYKYIVKSLGTAGFIDNGRLILQGKFTEDEIQKEIEDYVRLYVLCKECNSPDTEFIREERVLMIRCLACGAKHPVRNI